MSIILGIETSCDETGAAVVADGRRVLSNLIASQIDIHREFGGVVPEIASRQHTKIISQLTEKALSDAGIEAPEGLDAVAATQGPGLMGSLLVGLCFAKSLAYAWRKPFIPVHHIEGHIFSAMLGERAPEFPFLALVVSGGHTQLVRCPEAHRYEILGATRDDAIGESFDKVARLLDLPYPGGPSIQKASETGDPEAFSFPRAMTDRSTLEFSYSGLKTAVLYALREGGGARVADLAASFQAAAVDVLMIKTKQALEQTRLERLVLAGGVAANRLLRQRLCDELEEDVFLPPLVYCVDNGAMIAAAAASRLRHGLTGDFRATASAGLAL
jgi:N6-L-threonylcarbamoyladenine synthase